MHDKQLLEPTPDISRLAAVFANSARSALCSALMSGTSWTVGKLAAYAHIARSTASEHVTVLVEAGIAREYRQGRHRYVTISGPAVGDLIERLGALSAAHFDTPHSLNASRHTQRFTAARTCYKHLAGRLGVDLAQWLVAQGYTDADFRVTPRGALLMERWGVAAAQSLTARPCIDTSQRLPHMGGELGNALCSAFFANGWIARVGDTRAVEPTARGIKAFSAASFDVARAMSMHPDSLGVEDA
ncbi:MAG: ArsR/SmtB family transcription factor [Corynebacterium flavescens]|uniref:ArsR/SmtB family transcription factor n=1 Tax=Corynebacterium flavescens TaxID=28028 RepID=UPI00257BF684|nr:helix-turn-helix domain-containing protein [Corynebacterium sp. UBA5992]